jgi:hypothetical protein
MRYLRYLLYVIEHKWNVFKVAVSKGMFIHAILHDMSKLSGGEFTQYANYFFKENPTEQDKQAFERAWRHHYFNNKHHWQYWTSRDEEDVPIDIPSKYIRQMVVDWTAMGIKFGDTAQEYYLDNYNEIELTEKTRYKLEWYLELNETLYKSLKEFYKSVHRDVFFRENGWIEDKYDVDLDSILKEDD